jgi:hypothetical protein
MWISKPVARETMAWARGHATERCSLTHEIFSAGGGHFARFVVGATRGWITGEPPSIEQVEERIAEIRDATDPVLPAGLAQEIELAQTLLR